MPVSKRVAENFLDLALICRPWIGQSARILQSIGGEHRDVAEFSAQLTQSAGNLHVFGKVANGIDRRLRAFFRAETTNIRAHGVGDAMLLLDGPSGIPEPGAARVDEGAVGWLADNQRKGISPGAVAVTVHATKPFSEKHRDADPQEIARLLAAEAAPLLKSGIADVRGHRWRYSVPSSTLPRGFFFVDGRAPLFFAGDTRQRIQQTFQSQRNGTGPRGLEVQRHGQQACQIRQIGRHVSVER